MWIVLVQLHQTFFVSSPVSLFWSDCVIQMLSLFLHSSKPSLRYSNIFLPLYFLYVNVLGAIYILLIPWCWYEFHIVTFFLEMDVSSHIHLDFTNFCVLEVWRAITQNYYFRVMKWFFLLFSEYLIFFLSGECCSVHDTKPWWCT